MINNLSKEIKKAIQLLNYTSFTDVQEKVIPEVLAGNDVIVKSQTGSGKTASFVIPICEKLDWDQKSPQALILTPTRELAMQVKEDVFNIGRFKRIKTSALYGKDSFTKQAKEIKQRTHIVVGTPGRVLDHIDRDTLDTSNIKYLVIDEADEMLAMGFIEQVSQIIDYLPTKRITILLSATMHDSIVRICDEYMNNPVQITMEQKSATVENVNQQFYEVPQSNKLALLRDVTITNNPDSCIIFCNMQVDVDEVEQYLHKHKYTCGKIHGGMEQEDRTKMMKRYRKGLFRYLVATDVAARGIDIDDIELVVNYDMPRKLSTYVHRIGRTGRIGKLGQSISFLDPKDTKLKEDLSKIIKQDIIFKPHPTQEELFSAVDDFQDKMQTKPLAKASKGDALNKDIMKLHINAGKKTKMRPLDVVGTICSIEGVTGEDIGIINLQDISTYVEILNGKGPLVLAILQNKPIKGRLRKVSIANEYDL